MEYAATAMKCKNNAAVFGRSSRKRLRFLCSKLLRTTFLRLRVDFSSGGPDCLYGPLLTAVHRPFQPLRRSQGAGLGQCVIRQYDGVKGISRGKARLLSKESGPGSGNRCHRLQAPRAPR